MKQEQIIDRRQCHHKHHHHDHNHERDEKKHEESHLLKRRIVKILKRKEQINFNDLVLKLDIQPSKLFRILKKLEYKGMIYQKKDQVQTDNGVEKLLKPNIPHKANRKCFHHQTGEPEKVKKGCHQCNRKDEHGAKGEKCGKHLHKKGKVPWQKAGNLTIGLVSA